MKSAINALAPPLRNRLHSRLTAWLHPTRPAPETRAIQYLRQLPASEFDEIYRVLVCDAPAMSREAHTFCARFPQLPLSRCSAILRQAARARHVTALQAACNSRKKLLPRMALVILTLLLINLQRSDNGTPLLAGLL